MAEPLATVDEVKARADWTLDADEIRSATDSIKSLSIQARYYSKQDWPTRAECPDIVWDMIVSAVVRYLRNTEGASQSRAGDETLMWENRRTEKAGVAYFVDDEIAELRLMASGSGDGYTGFGVIQTYAWNNGAGRTDLTIGTTPGHGEPFPWIAKEDDLYW